MPLSGDCDQVRFIDMIKHVKVVHSLSEWSPPPWKNCFNHLDSFAP